MKLLILEGLHGDNKGKKCQWRLKRTNLKVGDTVVLDNMDWKIIKIINEVKRTKGVVFSEFATTYGNWGLPTSEEINTLLESLKQTPGNTIFTYHRKAGKNTAYEIIMGEKKRREKEALSELRNRPYFKTVVEEVKGKPRGEENLEKIKFPCWCSFYNGHYIGQINTRYHNKMIYDLHDINDKQTKGTNRVGSEYSLKKLIEKYDIEILKGELRLWKEVE